MHASAPAPATADPFYPAFVPVPIPEWMPYKEGTVKVDGASLYYRDSGGDGIPIILVHPVTGSALVWSYQQPAFVKAGYRVIAYSRRGHYGSTPALPENPGVPSHDLRALADALGLGRFILLGSAAGTAHALDFAMDHSDRLRAMIVAAGTYLYAEEPEYRPLLDRLRVDGFNDLPGSFRELSPAYRAANPEGVRAWQELEHKAITGTYRGTTFANPLTWTTLARINTPTLFIAGGADLHAPPTLMREVTRRVPNARMLVMSDTGHSPYWEEPEVFNAHVLDFLRAHVRG